MSQKCHVNTATVAKELLKSNLGATQKVLNRDCSHNNNTQWAFRLQRTFWIISTVQHGGRCTNGSLLQEDSTYSTLF